MDRFIGFLQIAAGLSLWFFGWWLPAVLFYAYGLALLLRARRRPIKTRVWLGVFALSLAYTLYDGVYLKYRFDQRALTFKNPVTYARPPDDVRTIQTSVQTSVQTTIGALASSQGCDMNCLRLLVSGRFDKVIIAYLEPLSRDRTMLYRTYAMVTQAGCKTWPFTLPVDPSLWQQAGRCITQTESETVSGRRFVVIEDQADDPGSPPWPIYLSAVQLVDGDRVTPIARAENTTHAEFAYPFPVPGFFAHGMTNGFPTDWRPGFLFSTYRYGASFSSWQFVGQVFGVAVNQPLPKPDATPSPQ
jgi:hypothetical protein